LFTIPAGKLSSHKSSAEKTQKEKYYDEDKDIQGKLLYQKHYASENGDNEHQKIRNNIFPRDCFLVELLRFAPLKKHRAQTTFTKRTGFAVIITVRAMPAHQPEFKEKNEKDITDDPHETKVVQDICTNTVDQE
jgi:hypothetical protein